MHNTLKLTALVTALLLSPALAAKYQVTDLDHLNIVTAESETDIENFTATTNKISGTVMFDASKKTGSADLVVNGASLNTGVKLRDDHMRSKDWFNFDKNPKITFKTSQVEHLSGNKYRVVGQLTLNGVSKAINTTAQVKLTPANNMTKAAKIAGDALAVSLGFDIKLSDFGISHKAVKGGRVSNTLKINVKFIATDK